jgi:hypothetical protein
VKYTPAKLALIADKETRGELVGGRRRALHTLPRVEVLVVTDPKRRPV